MIATTGEPAGLWMALSATLFGYLLSDAGLSGPNRIARKLAHCAGNLHGRLCNDDFCFELFTLIAVTVFRRPGRKTSSLIDQNRRESSHRAHAPLTGTGLPHYSAAVSNGQ